MRFRCNNCKEIGVMNNPRLAELLKLELNSGNAVCANCGIGSTYEVLES